MIKGVVFDLDGVLIDSPKIYFKVMKDFLQNHDLEVTDRVVSNFISLSLKDEFLELTKKYSIDVSFDDFLKETLEKSLAISKKELTVCVGVKELLADLKEKNFLLAVASNNNKRTIDFVFEKFGFSDFFSTVVTGEDVVHGKPHPEIYLNAVQFLGVKPFECVGIEDTLIGVRSVKAAGLKCIAVPNSFAGHVSFQEADLVVKELTDLNSKRIIGL